jgi:hypothetical protein
VKFPVAPKGLGPEGRSVWSKVRADAAANEYELRPDEVVTLSQACRALDRLEELREALAGQQLLTVGSTRQVVVHPLVAEVRAHEAHVAALLARIKLPDQAGVAVNQRRAAGLSSWAAANGRAS